MLTADRATCIAFSDDDLPPEGSNHVRLLFIDVACLGRRVPSVLLDNGFALNVCDSTHGSLALKAYQQNLYLEYYLLK